MENQVKEVTNQKQTWLDEIRAMEHELDNFAAINGNIASAAPDGEVRKQVEHFQNLFIVQKGRLDEMKHSVKVFGADPGLDDYKNYFEQLKTEFSNFSSSWN